MWERSQARLASRLVLLALADFADEGGQAWPSVETLARHCALGRRRVQMALRELEAAGEIVVSREAGVHGVNLYRITMGVPEENAASVDGVQRKPATSAGADGKEKRSSRRLPAARASGETPARIVAEEIAGASDRQTRSAAMTAAAATAETAGENAPRGALRATVDRPRDQERRGPRTQPENEWPTEDKRPQQEKELFAEGSLPSRDNSPPPLWFPESLGDAAFRKKWSDWEEHCRAGGKPLSRMSRVAQLSQCERHGRARALAVIELAFVNNWKSLVWDSGEQRARHANLGPTHSANPRATRTLNGFGRYRVGPGVHGGERAEATAPLCAEGRGAAGDAGRDS